MIQKRKEDGSFTELINSEKSPPKFSQTEWETILQNPALLTRAQRAFLKDGSTSQCLNVLLNILEDFKEKQKQNDKSQLYLLAYDQVKAYDSVQEYTIKASLARFNLPPGFISYVLSNLHEATSCFKTFYGPTKEVKVETSVRQGDPLSPLIYVFVTDALHEGLQNNPLYGCKTGYKFSNNQNLNVGSLGYADDTLTFTESWAAQWMSHEWVRDFCHAHHFKLNAKKSNTLYQTIKAKLILVGSPQ